MLQTLYFILYWCSDTYSGAPNVLRVLFTKEKKKKQLTSWLGNDTVAESRLEKAHTFNKKFSSSRWVFVTLLDVASDHFTWKRKKSQHETHSTALKDMIEKNSTCKQKKPNLKRRSLDHITSVHRATTVMSTIDVWWLAPFWKAYNIISGCACGSKPLYSPVIQLDSFQLA